MSVTPFPARPAQHTADTLTERENEIVSLLAEANTNRDIASALGITEETVKRHVSNILDKTGLGNRLELVVQYLHRKFEAERRHFLPQAA